MLLARSAASRAHFRSHSGHYAGAALAHAPTSPEYVIAPYLFRVVLLERLQLPHPVGEAVCSGCRAPLDPLGRHRAACPRTGGLRTRASPSERMLARVYREAGARLRFNAFLRDINVNVAATDERRIEVLAQDVPCFGAAQLAVDITLRCVLPSAGEPHTSTPDLDGAALVVAREDKERICPSVTKVSTCRRRHCNWRQVEQRSGRFRETLGLRQNPGGAPLHAVLHSPRLTTTLDADAVDCFSFICTL